MPKFNIERVEKPATVEGYIVTFTPEQLTYVVAVIGATVQSGSIPRYAQGLYDDLSDSLEADGLINKDWDAPKGRDTDEAGVPYASRLFQHLGLVGFKPPA